MRFIQPLTGFGPTHISIPWSQLNTILVCTIPSHPQFIENQILEYLPTRQLLDEVERKFDEAWAYAGMMDRLDPFQKSSYQDAFLEEERKKKKPVDQSVILDRVVKDIRSSPPTQFKTQITNFTTTTPAKKKGAPVSYLKEVYNEMRAMSSKPQEMKATQSGKASPKRKKASLKK